MLLENSGLTLPPTSIFFSSSFLYLNYIQQKGHTITFSSINFGYFTIYSKILRTDIHIPETSPLEWRRLLLEFPRCNFGCYRPHYTFEEVVEHFHSLLLMPKGLSSIYYKTTITNFDSVNKNILVKQKRQMFYLVFQFFCGQQQVTGSAKDDELICISIIYVITLSHLKSILDFIAPSWCQQSIEILVCIHT